MNVFIVRHGETDWNKEFRLQGRTEILLNERGRSQALATAAGLKREGIEFDTVYSSPLLRAVETSELISGKESQGIKTDERIIELSFGIAEGTTPEERESSEKLKAFNNFFSAPEQYVATDGAESLQSVLARTGDFLNSEIKNLELENTAKNVLIVTHGGTLQALLMNIDHRGISHYWDIHVPNCTVNLVTLQHGIFKVEYTAKVFY